MSALQLRQYQLDAIEGVRAQLRGGAKRVLVIAPTGSGKTVMFSEIVSRAAEGGRRSLILAHRRELISQTVAKVMACGIAPGVIQAGVRPAPQRLIQVASVQTLIQRPNACPKADLVIVDEAHHFVDGNSYGKILARYPGTCVLGFTATPWRLDGAGLADVFDAHVIARTPRQLRDDGFLAPVGGWEFLPVDTSKARVSGGDYVAKSLEHASMDPKLFGEIIGEWKAHAGGVRTVLFACTINHSLALAKAFRDAGVAAEHLDGTTPATERAGILARIRSGETRVLCNVNVATEGWDEPGLECVILARPTLSTALALQMIGRILRPSPGKVLARIHDHARILATHGHPYAERDYSPEVTARSSRKAAEQGTGVVRNRKCPRCEAIVVGWPCDACNFQPGPEAIAHELAAERRAIGEADAPVKKKKQWSDDERLNWWGENMPNEEAKRQFFLRMVMKHGSQKAPRVYYWCSGKREWPPASWQLAAPTEHGYARLP